MCEIYISTFDNSSYFFSLNKFSTANGKVIQRSDLKASNGMVHIISSVMYPLPSLSIPDVCSVNPDLSTLGDLLFKAGLIKTLQGKQ